MVTCTRADTVEHREEVGFNTEWGRGQKEEGDLVIEDADPRPTAALSKQLLTKLDSGCGQLRVLTLGEESKESTKPLPWPSNLPLSVNT